MVNNNTQYYDWQKLENDEVNSINEKSGFKITSFLLLIFSFLGWMFAVFSTLMSSNDAYLPWGCVFFVIMSVLTYLVARKFKNDFCVKKGDLYFKVSHYGIEYTSINEMSGGVGLHEIRWADIATNSVHSTEADIHFYNNGYKNNTKNIVIYVSHQTGVVEQVLIPVHNIKKFKDSWKIIRAILINIASLDDPKLIIAEEVFYYFNINPETFEFRRKNIRRMFADIFVIGGGIAVGFVSVFCGISLGGWLKIDLKYSLIPALILGVAVAILFIYTLMTYSSFFINSYPKFIFIGYEKQKIKNGLQNHSKG